MIDVGPIPAGFAIAFTSGTSVLVADIRYAEEFLRLGLHQPTRWEALLSGDADRSGRGATARCRLESGRVARLKQLRRGGLVGSLWGDRFVGVRRVAGNLTLPVEAARRGVETPVPLGLLVVGAGPGLVRAWLVLEDLENVVDLAAAFRSDEPPSRSELSAVMEAVRRMHDHGVEHRDLNCGNLLLCRDPVPRAIVIDLDAARLHPGPLPFSMRQRALRRLERSHVKLGFDAARADDYFGLYAADDTVLAARLARGRSAGRLQIRLHRLIWRP